MIRIKSNVAVKELTHGVDVRLINVVMWMNDKFNDVSITGVSRDELALDAGIYKKPVEVAQAINNYYKCATFFESTKTLVLKVST